MEPTAKFPPPLPPDSDANASGRRIAGFSLLLAAVALVYLIVLAISWKADFIESAGLERRINLRCLLTGPLLVLTGVGLAFGFRGRSASPHTATLALALHSCTLLAGFVGLCVAFYLFVCDAVKHPARLTDSRNAVSAKIDRAAFQKSSADGYRKRCDARIRYNLKQTLEPYRKSPNHDAKWDALMERACDLESRVRMLDVENENPLKDEMAVVCLELRQSGCSDPLAGYWELNWTESFPKTNPPAACVNYGVSYVRLKQDGYPPIRLFYAAVRAAREQGRRDSANRTKARDWLDLAERHFEEMIADPETPSAELSQAAEFYISQSQRSLGERWEAFQKLDAAFAKSRPQSPARFISEGEFYAHYAWDARRGFSSKSTGKDSGKSFKERLGLAQKALEKAYSLDPGEPRGPEIMLTVAAGLGLDRDEMEEWFKRAMAANPGSYTACSRKLYYLLPFVQGGEAQMLQFGRACYELGDWDADVPMILAAAHHKISWYEDKDEYFSRPEVWNELSRAYEERLRRTPDAFSHRTHYAILACKTGHWEVAKRQFDALGDLARVDLF
ncbi:MAG: hypothetical protein JO317_01205, partial [Verrucomicrobiae bacterium]|nr:hypothetical protein [Verrucomicrobiae bacterium]